MNEDRERDRERRVEVAWHPARERARKERRWWESRNREAANRSAKARKFYRRRKTVRPCVPRVNAVAMPLLLVSQRRNLNGSERVRWREACILFIGNLRWRKRARECSREQLRGARDNAKILVSRGRFCLAKLATQMRLANSSNEPKPRWVMVAAIIATGTR